MQAVTTQGDGGCSIRRTPIARAAGSGDSSHSPVLSASFGVGLVPDEGAAEFFGVSRRTFTDFMDAEWMPKPIYLGPRLRRWSLEELREAVARMPRQETRTQPESLLRARIERLKATGRAQ